VADAAGGRRPSGGRIAGHHVTGSDATGQVVGTPPERLDAETERKPVGHATQVVDGTRGGL
jgi:hypothetical protein